VWVLAVAVAVAAHADLGGSEYPHGRCSSDSDTSRPADSSTGRPADSSTGRPGSSDSGSSGTSRPTDEEVSDFVVGSATLSGVSQAVAETVQFKAAFQSALAMQYDVSMEQVAIEVTAISRRRLAAVDSPSSGRSRMLVGDPILVLVIIYLSGTLVTSFLLIPQILLSDTVSVRFKTSTGRSAGRLLLLCSMAQLEPRRGALW
jgi:hypothetical protein